MLPFLSTSAHISRASLPSFLGTMLVLLALSVTLSACDDDNPAGPAEQDLETIVELVESTPELSTLSAALNASGLTELFDSNEDDYTLFAPQNSAFGGLDVDEITGNDDILTRVLRQHAVGAQSLFLADIPDGANLISVDGGILTFSTNGGATINGANIVTPDIEASNGVAHVIDQVLLGRLDALQRTVVTSDLELLQAAVEAAPASIATALQGDGNGNGLTVFAPSNAAFIELLDANDDGTVDNAELTSVDLARVLQYHVLPDVTEAGDIPTETTTVQTLLGEPVDIIRNAETGAVTLTLSDGSTVSVATADIGVRNGVVHTLDGVLVPPPSN